MARSRNKAVAHRRHKKILKLAKGYRGGHGRLFRQAREAVMHAGQYAYRDRRQLKRDMRRLWISRIGAAARTNGLTYGDLMHGLNLAGAAVNRKMLADLAVRDPEAFEHLVVTAREQLAASP